MRALQAFSQSGGSLIANYAAQLSEAVMRHGAETEVRAARVEAEHAIRARSEFLANMNHELRTPLNAIIGFATMLRDIDGYDLSDEQKRSYAEYILQSADLLLGHINTLLEVAALESGAVELNDDVIDFNALLNGAMERAGVRAGAAAVAIERRDKGEDVLAWGDPERTEQALDHLLQIAIKSCERGGKVLVRACRNENGWGEVAVRDNGAGFGAEELREALEAFQQIHRGLDRSFAGPGVGYAVAKTFIEMQGGQFIVKSKPGQGTLVRMALPPPDKARAPADGAQDAPLTEEPRKEEAYDAA